MAKLILKADSPEQELELHKDLTEYDLRKSEPDKANAYIELQREADREAHKRKGRSQSEAAAERVKKVRRLYDEYKAANQFKFVQGIKDAIADELKVHPKTVEKHLKESKK